MKSLRTTVFLTGLTFLIMSAMPLFCQENLKLNLKLNSTDKFTPIPDSGEFKLSLDSQLFEARLIDEPLNDDGMGIINRSKADSLEDIVFSGTENQPILSLSGSDGENKKFSSMLTLTTGYSQLSLDDSTVNSGLKLEKKLGKFKILGEFDQQKITRIPVPSKSNGFSANANSALRASIINASLNENDVQNKNSALASRYYLEAIYSFKPTVSGKLSYRRSMVDTIESEEELQFEGIVEANKNILIKAGYNNETRPEVNEPKSTKDSKVWTEFILKF